METLIAQMGIIALMVGTPGPNNLMLMSSGVHFGIRRTLPLVAGIIVGCTSMLAVLAAGLAPLLQNHPEALHFLRVACAGFVLYLAARLLTADPAVHRAGKRLSPFRLWQGAAFQWVNPKAWMMCLTLLALSPPGSHSVASTSGLLAVFALLSAPMLATWSAAGQSLKGWLSHGQRLLWFNRATAAALTAMLFMLW